jgi:chromosome segregation ATPase
VFKERGPRFSAEERARGWHVQYDGFKAGASFLREPSSLTPYDPWSVRLDLALRHRGVEALEQERAVLREDLARRGEELAAVRAQLADCRQELSSARDVVTRLDRELASSREDVKLLHHHREVARNDLAAREERLTALQYRLESILSSRIWRWTSSLRASIDALSRR